MTEDSVLQFILPANYQQAEDIPKPDNPDIQIVRLPEKVVAVHKFSGTNNPQRSHKKLGKLRAALVQDQLLADVNLQGDLEHSVTWNVVEYHPYVTLPLFRRNEVWIEPRVQDNAALQQLLAGQADMECKGEVDEKEQKASENEGGKEEFKSALSGEGEVAQVVQVKCD